MAALRAISRVCKQDLRASHRREEAGVEVLGEPSSGRTRELSVERGPGEWERKGDGVQEGLPRWREA